MLPFMGMAFKFNDLIVGVCRVHNDDCNDDSYFIASVNTALSTDTTLEDALATPFGFFYDTLAEAQLALKKQVCDWNASDVDHDTVLSYINDDAVIKVKVHHTAFDDEWKRIYNWR